MIITIHQPAYLPWLGYFEKIIKSDIYVYLDSVQYEDRSFTNRNRIKTPTGTQWLSIPVKAKGYRDSIIKYLEIDNSQNWRKKHLNTIYLNYKKAPFFSENYPKLELLFANQHDFLCDLCYEHLLFWLGEIGVKKNIIRSQFMQVDSKKSDLILDICKELQAKQYISGKLGRGYLQEEAFREEGIEVIYQDYQHPTYRQLWGDFIPNLSILDFWMNSDNYQLITGGEQNGILK